MFVEFFRMLCVDMFEYVNGLFTLPDSDSDPNPGTDFHSKNGYSSDWGLDRDLNWSLCNVKMLCIV